MRPFSGEVLGPIQVLEYDARLWKVYLPALGVFRYRLQYKGERLGQRMTIPVVHSERGTPFDRWQPDDREIVKKGILRAHGWLK